ncbi:unnamed protein product [Dibothriocephalus latus]|uniref:Major vault protein n=1 Tax=Dibothriocephalus latus TaxID=60516 RepID=A0A3P7MY47_DIBLA|nr:unnamed protein product [Dibothriocephalus latus]
MSTPDCVSVAIPPYHFIHVLDKNTNVSKLVSGPATFFRKDHEKIVKMPQGMITITPKSYCKILNPVKKDEIGNVIIDEYDQASLAYGDEEYRFAQPPFPLYPGEELVKEVTPLTILSANSALLLSALVNFQSEGGVDRTAGERWLLEGPERVNVLKAYNLDEKHALHVKAKRTHVDDFGKRRRHGEEWLITHLDAESHIPSVDEEVVKVVSPIVLSSTNYCVICDPVDDKGVPKIGKKVLIQGEKAFFLMPGERLDAGINNVYVLGQNEGIILRAMESFQDGNTVGLLFSIL